MCEHADQRPVESSAAPDSVVLSFAYCCMSSRRNADDRQWFCWLGCSANQFCGGVQSILSTYCDSNRFSKFHLQDWKEWFLRSIRLWLFDANCLWWCFQLYAIEMYVKSSNFFDARRCLHINSIAMQLRMACYLKMILFLTHKSIIWVGKVKAFVSVNAKMRSCPEHKWKYEKVMGM